MTASASFGTVSGILIVRHRFMEIHAMQSYSLVEDEDHTYAVVDARSFETVVRSGIILEHLSPQVAEGIIPVLEALDRHREMPK
ncbi:MULTISPECIES: hypothetical protein [Rhizobium]|uniref:Nitrogen regulatory protein PII-like uncharacterized protein n=4 Tax=Rhizobium TaxID=379 RepID=A0A6P1CGF5_RHITR|nr:MULTISPECIES: hypothetical protein [Rhizobium]MBB6305296.1 nitrogen regulatory protein PII-like uncharacterized protein [Rhizobium leucaenae]MBB6489600.1 nitrogen regulatory protein PII-like uncharacterized protein [Rhizobium lusitanum]MBB6495944.1 nitrogen regulatory protein PII-like uncharacterized protein [Rhizobium tropici]MDK4743478.1 hypothetical protein [Rhizobium sp. CNPSo 3464]NEV15416.1 hypothetical protein [Rhizobium tropici]